MTVSLDSCGNYCAVTKHTSTQRGVNQVMCKNVPFFHDFIGQTRQEFVVVNCSSLLELFIEYNGSLSDTTRC